MNENPFVNTSINSTTTFLVNPEAHTSLQLLRRPSTDEGEDDDDDGDDDITEADGNEEVEEENGDNTLVRELNNTQLTHSASAQNVPVLGPYHSSAIRGCGIRSSITTRPDPVPAPVGIDCAIMTNEEKSNNTLSTRVNGDDRTLVTEKATITTDHAQSRRTNEHFNHKHTFREPFNTKLDFLLNASTMKIVYQDEAAYRNATRNLDNNEIIHEPTRTYSDIWAFGLNSRTTRLYRFSEFESQRLNSSQELPTPQTCLSPIQLLRSNSLFWLVFERRPIFDDPEFNTDVEAMKDQLATAGNNTILGQVKFFHAVQARLSYGALTSMNQYYYHPEFDFQKRSEWTVQFRLKKLEIDRCERTTRMSDSHGYEKVYRKSILLADLIDRAAVFTLYQSGFSVHICTKGNLHECTRVVTNVGKNRFQTERISSVNNDCPIFSTIFLHASVKTDSYNTDDDKYSALGQVKTLFTYLIDFFYNNQIPVCFASIVPRRGCLTNLQSLSSVFTTPIQLYGFAMLRKVGYAVEQKISERPEIRTMLLQLSGNDDDKFYRLCLNLFRRSTEYHFLNLETELEEAEKQYENQLKQCENLRAQMATILSPPRANYAYVPSIRVTPTTIQVQPLKLVKLHRVLREKNFNDPMSLALVEIRDEANKPLYPRDFRSLRTKFKQILTDGILINKTRYRYLHHSMSQVKEKQFWFLDNQYSLENVLSWMGNFDNERVIAKHAARIAQCFTSTEPSIRIFGEVVKYIPDIETVDKQYCFTDGVGTISKEYCKLVQKALNRRYMPSVLQIRYGGCKGTLSVDPNLDDQPHKLIIRESMRKFTSDHDQLEICKVSSPRALYLNRQDILLLAGRDVPESHFLVLQNENHFWLVQALLSSSIAFELLNDRVGSNCFQFREIASAINLVEEPFFLQLIITAGHDCVSKFQQRAKIKIAKNKARNMFGIVDEYGVLEYGQVFIQYNHMNDEKLDVIDKPPSVPPTILDNVKVVITKNPCHHPGDLRTFMAVDRPELRHLVDVVVFPQKGHRPHPNEISGSDLDGDEYAVIWDFELVPVTPNDNPYDYDSQEKPIKLDRPVKRNDINEIVLDIAAQNLTGDMSNLHLALADLLGTRNHEVVRLAGLISQELDAPKTGKHPVTSEDLHRYRNDLLKDKYPDFMMRERFKSYPSEKIIGQLYRSARRAIIQWHKAARSHCSLRHLHAAKLDDELIDDENTSTQTKKASLSHGSVRYQSSGYSSSRHEPSLTLDRTLNHRLAKDQISWATNIFYVYRENLLNIISIFNYQDEIDLFCRCEALDQLGSGKQDLNISAGLELQRLIDTTRHHFYYDFDQLASSPSAVPLHRGSCSRDRFCVDCDEIKLARAAACYYVCYSHASKQSTKARSRILSFPWLFGSLLTKLKIANQNLNNGISISKYIVVGRAMRNVARGLIERKELKLKILWPVYADMAHIFLRPIKSTTSHSLYPFKRNIIQHDEETNAICLLKILFIEIMNYWIRKQDVFGQYITPIAKKPIIREICWHKLLIQFISMTNEEILDENTSYSQSHFEDYKVVFQSSNNSLMTQRYTEYIRREITTSSVDFDNTMYSYCVSLVRLCFRLAREQKSNEYAYLSDYLILALQSIGIEKELNDLSIVIDN